MSFGAGVHLYVDSYGHLDARYIEAGYKVFAFERAVFNVPARFRVGERFPYATLGNPLIPEGTTTYVDFLWPYSIGNAGQLTLSGFGVGQISGPPYNPIADFDQIAARLPRRPLDIDESWIPAPGKDPRLAYFADLRVDDVKAEHLSDHPLEQFIQGHFCEKCGRGFVSEEALKETRRRYR